jgi:hypothetical protein
MKTYCLVMLTVLAASLSVPRLPAQSVYTGVGTSGMFGYRTIGGAPLGVVTPSMFGNRFVGPTLNSFYTGAQNGTATRVWYRGQEPYSASYLPPISVTQPAIPANEINTMNNVQELPTLEQPVLEQPAPVAEPVPYPVPYPVPVSPNAPGAVTPSEQAPAASPAGGAAPAANAEATIVPYPHAWTFSPAITPSRKASATRSADLSDRLTRIARDKGMLAEGRLNVALYGSVAVIEGAVRTPGDRNALANVLSLEPRVQRIDNRLYTVESNTVRSVGRENR